MKALIWIVGMLVYCLIVTVLKEEAGITLGAIPTIILLGADIWLMRTFCKKWDEHKRRNAEDAICFDDQESIATEQSEATEAEPTLCTMQPTMDGNPIADTDTAPNIKKENAISKKAFIAVICVGATAIICACVFGFFAVHNYNIAVHNYEALNSWKTAAKTLEDKVADLETELTDAEKINNEKEDEIQELQKDVSEYKTAYAECFDQAYFLLTKIGFIVEGSNYYHTYDCRTFQNADEYWAHNIEYCEYLGYSKCRSCW